MTASAPDWAGMRVVSGPRRVSVTNNTVFAALASKKRYHTLYMLYRLLEQTCGTGTTPPTNRQLADQLDLHRDTVQKLMRLLEQLGLVVQRVAFDQSRALLLPDLGADHVKLMEAIGAGIVELDIPNAEAKIALNGQPIETPHVDIPADCGFGTLRSPDRTPTVPRPDPLRSPDRRSDVSRCESTTEGAEQPGQLENLEYYRDRSISGTSTEDHTTKYKSNSENIQAAPEPIQAALPMDLPAVPAAPPKHGGERRGAGRPAKPIEPEVREVLEFWQSHLGYENRMALSPERVRIVRARLKEGFSVEELQNVVRVAKTDPWLNGTDPNNNRGKYDDIDNIMGSRTKVEKNLGKFARPNNGRYDRKALHLSSTAKVTSVEWF